MRASTTSSSRTPSRAGSKEAPAFRGAVLPSQVPEPAGEPSHLLRSAVKISSAAAGTFPRHMDEMSDDPALNRSVTAVSLLSNRSMGARISVSSNPIGGIRGRTIRQSILSGASSGHGPQVSPTKAPTIGWPSSVTSTSSSARSDEEGGGGGETPRATPTASNIQRLGTLKSRPSLSRGAFEASLRPLSVPEEEGKSTLRQHLEQLSRTLRRRAVLRCRQLIKARAFQVFMFVALMLGLFLPDIWILADRPTNNDLDVLLTFVVLAFLTDLAVQSIGLSRTYWGSVFFWTDLLGVASMLLDINYIAASLWRSIGQNTISGNAVVTRVARVAKLGARAGRFTKLVKLMRFLPGLRVKGADLGTAKQISNQLTILLSTRVSCLIILMVMIMPIFNIWSFPTADWSSSAWLEILEALLDNEDTQFAEQLDRFTSFYASLGYYPYRLELKAGVSTANATAALLPWTSSRGVPKRAANIVRRETASLICSFSFKQPWQIQSLMNVILMVFVILLMLIFSLVLSNSVSAIVLRPLEKLLLQVRVLASQIFQSVKSISAATEAEDAEKEEDDENDSQIADPRTAFGSETALLEKVVAKLTTLNEITMNKTGLDAEAMAALGEGDRAVITGFAGAGAPVEGHHDKPGFTRSRSMELDFQEEDKASSAAHNAMLESAGLSPDLLNSWNLNPLELDRARNRAAMLYVLGQQNHGIHYDGVVMGTFLDVAEAGYIKNVPYHNWFHAVDVTHCVFRLLRVCGAEAYLNSSERYALLVSATCHDVGHPGLNNVFLVEASYDLAVLYNDKSPLENMHCSRLFEFVGMPKCNIFQNLSKHQFQEVRKCCIESILHTDNVHHFPMIKEVQMLYEVNSEVLDAGRFGFKQEFFPPKDTVEVFRQADSRKLLVRLFLHVADISNCSKPFRICRIWAQRVLEEFFMQGDEEKKANMPVQALNDREKVNRPMSQIGFIEFLVSPLQFAVIKVLPPIAELAERMVENTKLWHKEWLLETKPQPTDADRQTLLERINKLEKRFLDNRPQ